MMSSFGAPTSSAGGVTDRSGAYKNRGAFKSADELRRRRADQQVELRRQKRDENLAKRRQIAPPTTGQQSSANGDDDELGLTTDEEEDDDDLEGLSDVDAAGNHVRVPLEAKLQMLMAALYSGVEAQQFAAAVSIRKMLSKERNPPIAQVIAAGAVAPLIHLLDHPTNAKLVFEASWALTNIASGDSSATEAVVSAGALPKFVHLLGSPDVDVVEQALWAISNIGGEGPKERDAVIAAGVIPILARMVADGSPLWSLPEERANGLLRNVAWTINNLARGKKPPPAWDQVRQTLPTLVVLLYRATDLDALVDAVWALSYLSDGPDHQIEDVLQCAALSRVVQLLLQPGAPRKLAQPGLRFLGNVCTGTDAQTAAAINCGALDVFRRIMQDPSASPALRKEVCWGLSNIAAGTTEQLQALIEANMVPLLIHELAHGDYRARKEACWAVANFAAQAAQQPAQVRFLVRQGALPPLCRMLAAKDTSLLITILDALATILAVGEQDKLAKLRQGHADAENEFALNVEEAGGMDALFDLQDHANHDVYLRTYQLIDAYFAQDTDEADEDGMMDEAGAGNGAPLVDPSTGMLMFGTAPQGGQQGDGSNAFGQGVPQGGFHF